MSIQRINIVGVPVDICRTEDIEEEVLRLVSKQGTKQIVFLSIWDLLKARRKNEYSECVRNADLILPISKSIIRGARFLKKPIPVRYNPFNAVIEILSALERHYKSIYLLGGHKPTIKKTEANVRATFPNLQIVGRYSGYYSRQAEAAIIEAIYKSSPSIVLISKGIKEKDVWVHRRRHRFASSIFIYYKDAFGIFAERIKRVSEKTFNRGHEIYTEIFHNPFKLFLIFPYLKYIVLLLWYKLFKKHK